MPTKAQFENLITKKVPQNTKVFINGETHTISNAYGFYNGSKARGLVLKDGVNVLFLPATGYRLDNVWFNLGTYGNYWSTMPSGSSDAYHLSLSATNCDVRVYYRRSGFSVRCVK